MVVFTTEPILELGTAAWMVKGDVVSRPSQSHAVAPPPYRPDLPLSLSLPLQSLHPFLPNAHRHEQNPSASPSTHTTPFLSTQRRTHAHISSAHSFQSSIPCQTCVTFPNPLEKFDRDVRSVVEDKLQQLTDCEKVQVNFNDDDS